MRRVGVLAVVLAVGCATPPEGEGAGQSTGGSTSTGPTTGSSAGEGSLSMTGASAGTSSEDSTSGSGSGSGSGSWGSSGSSSTGGGTTSGGDPCVGLGQEECAAEHACEPIACRPFVRGRNGECIDMPEFIGCRSAQRECAGGRTHTCEDQDATVFVCSDSCIPAGWMLCDPPVKGAMNCP